MSEPFAIARPLLEWFEKNHRVLPFRSDPTPYHVWVSEIMLQQTRVAAALPYYERFIAELPDIPALAACSEERLHKLWEGLGYYSRVRNLQKAARLLCETNGGCLPADLEALKKLPGIGEYTAGAVASIGFGIPAPAVDGNVLRVFARLYNDEGDVLQPETKKRTTGRVMAQQPAQQPGDFNQALMELGALVCLPQNPACGECPLQGLCLARQAGTQKALPVKAPKKARKIQSFAYGLVRDGEGRWLLHRRPAEGVLAGLWEPLPLGEGEFTVREAQQALQAVLPGARLTTGKGRKAKHIFTHLEWHMTGWQAEAEGPAPEGCVWVTGEQMKQDYALPGAFKSFCRDME